MRQGGPERAMATKAVVALPTFLMVYALVYNIRGQYTLISRLIWTVPLEAVYPIPFQARPWQFANRYLSPVSPVYVCSSSVVMWYVETRSRKVSRQSSIQLQDN